MGFLCIAVLAFTKSLAVNISITEAHSCDENKFLRLVETSRPRVNHAAGGGLPQHHSFAKV